MSDLVPSRPELSVWAERRVCQTREVALYGKASYFLASFPLLASHIRLRAYLEVDLSSTFESGRHAG
jgi:hypothetical protein